MTPSPKHFLLLTALEEKDEKSSIDPMSHDFTPSDVAFTSDEPSHDGYHSHAQVTDLEKFLLFNKNNGDGSISRDEMLNLFPGFSGSTPGNDAFFRTTALVMNADMKLSTNIFYNDNDNEEFCELLTALSSRRDFLSERTM